MRKTLIKGPYTHDDEPKGPIFFRGGATHYSDGEGSLTIHMVRVRKHARLSRRGCVSTLTIHMVRVLTLTHHMGEGPYFFIGAEPLTIHMVRGHSLFIW